MRSANLNRLVFKEFYNSMKLSVSLNTPFHSVFLSSSSHKPACAVSAAITLWPLIHHAIPEPFNMLTSLFSMQLELTKKWGKSLANRLNDQHCNKACWSNLTTTFVPKDNLCGDKSCLGFSTYLWSNIRPLPATQQIHTNTHTYTLWRIVGEATKSLASSCVKTLVVHTPIVTCCWRGHQVLGITVFKNVTRICTCTQTVTYFWGGHQVPLHHYA